MGSFLIPTSVCAAFYKKRSLWHTVACIASTLEASPFCSAIVNVPLFGRCVWPLEESWRRQYPRFACLLLASEIDPGIRFGRM